MPSRRIFKERILREARQQGTSTVLDLSASFASLVSAASVIATDSFPFLTSTGTTQRATASVFRTYVLGISGGTATIPENVTIQGNTTLGNATSDQVVLNARMGSGFEWATDNLYDIGASGANRPRNLFLAGNATIGGTLNVTGVATLLNAALKLGTDASGTNAAATSVTTTGPLSTGNATPAALVWQVGVQGASGTTPQAATEGWRVQETANATARELSAMNVTGPVMGGLPTNVTTTMLEASDGGRFANRIKGVRAAAAATISGARVNGTLSAPTQVLSGQSVAVFGGRGYTSAAATSGDLGQVEILTREDLTGTAWGGLVRINARQVGTTSNLVIADFRAGGANIAEWVSQQTNLRIIPGSGGVSVRDSGNTLDAALFNAAGTLLTLNGGLTLAATLTHNGATALLSQIASGTAIVNVGTGTQAAGTQISLRAPAGQTRNIQFQSGTTGRWDFQTNAVAESGGDAGSNFQIVARDDAGAVIDTVLQLTRAALQPAIFNRGVTMNEAGNDQDTRIEGDTLTHAFLLDAGQDSLGLFTSAVPNFQSGRGIMFIGNATTNPTGNPSGGYFLYADSTGLYVRSPSGAVTSIAPP